MKRRAFCTLILVSLGACESQGPAVVFDERDLLQHWVRSTEEELVGDSAQVFRPAGSMDFPPSRFRMAYTFAENGACEWYFLSPDDNHRFKPGSWRIDRGAETLLRVTADGTTTTFRIARLSKSELTLIPRTTQ